MTWLIGTILATALVQQVQCGIDPWVSPEYKYIHQFPLPIPPIAVPLTSYTDANKTIDFYQINIEKFDAQTYPDLNKTSYVGYNGTAPGPTFHMTKGREAVVRFVNNYDRPSSIHLHGSYSRTPFDGWAEDVTKAGQYKDYYYPNAQPQRTLWYHDHAIGITAVNAYFGQAGFYILNDPNTDVGLPSGEFDIPLMIAAKQFLSDGKLLSPELERVSLYGDVITVNAQPWPYLSVKPRKYKFRILDASISRTYKLYLAADSDPTTRIPFTVVGADAGFLDHAVASTSLVIAMAERYEIVIDFAKYGGQNLTLMNERNWQTNPDYPATDRVLRFVVGAGPALPTTDPGNGALVDGAHLANLNVPNSAAHPVIDHSFTFERTNGQWLINGVGFENVPNRVLAFPKRGRVERWELINTSGGWSHPIHIHLIDFQVVKRSGGRGAVEPYEAAAFKDVVYLGMNGKVEVVANYAPWDGIYMFHCHNLVHEDHDMMAAFNVTDIDLSSYGYSDKVSFVDPMIQQFQAKPYSGTTDLAVVKNVTLRDFANLNAYPNGLAVESALEDYWSKQPTATTLVTSVKTSGGASPATTTTKVSTTKTSTSKASTST
ncbi:bilirubin oxidase precursor [Cryomyces antarcticus]